MKFNKPLLLLILCLFIYNGLLAQSSTFVDDKGIMRWTESNEEVCAFGANYSEPFSSWREHEALGVSHEEAIDADVYHLARMGFTGYRIHVWETYICDYEGNLLFNKHLQLFDYLLYKLKERNIKIFLTPINFYGGSTSGFHNKYGGKKGCLTDEASFPSQENYLAQFASHVNPYTGIAYKDDPDIIGFEICNEPFDHADRPDLTTQYIQRMIEAIRGTGCEKPIFYNVSHNIEQIDKFCAADIQGGTFQWYPTGLYSNHDQKGNMLPNIDKFHIPFANNPNWKNKAKISYEFSPSDVANSAYMYPVMARSFREAGFQFAAQFAYSPMNVGFANIEYRAHYLSLPWAPKKSMGMVLAKEVFHNVPLGKSYGRYPDNTAFDAFRVSYEDDVAEMLTDEKFIYTSTTNSLPTHPEKLKQVAGTGNSAIVSYPGTGAYFIDKLEDGVWRLEVMPDAILVADPHFSTAMDKEVSAIQWNEWQMQLNLPNLGEGFSVKGLNKGNDTEIVAKGKKIPISPGSYLLSRKGKIANLSGDTMFNNMRLNEFYAPKSRHKKTWVLHQEAKEITAGSTITISANVVAPKKPKQVDLVLVMPDNHKAIPMQSNGPFEYSTKIPATYVENVGFLKYYITVGDGDSFQTFPAGTKASHPIQRKLSRADRKFFDSEPYVVRIMKKEAALCLFDAEDDGEQITNMYRTGYADFVPSELTGKTLVHYKSKTLKETPYHNTRRMYCRDRIETRFENLKGKKELYIYGHALNNKSCKVQVALVMKNGSAHGTVLTLNTDEKLYSVSLKDFKPVETYIMPRPIPRFEPYTTNIKSKFNLKEVEHIQITIGPEIAMNELKDEHGIAIGRILLK